MRKENNKKIKKFLVITFTIVVLFLSVVTSYTNSSVSYKKVKAYTNNKDITLNCKPIGRLNVTYSCVTNTNGANLSGKSDNNSCTFDTLDNKISINCSKETNVTITASKDNETVKRNIKFSDKPIIGVKAQDAVNSLQYGETNVDTINLTEADVKASRAYDYIITAANAKGYYPRYFLFNANNINENLKYSVVGSEWCKEITDNTSTNYNTGFFIDTNANGASVLIKIYSSKDACVNDNDSTNNKDVVMKQKLVYNVVGKVTTTKTTTTKKAVNKAKSNDSADNSENAIKEVQDNMNEQQKKTFLQKIIDAILSPIRKLFSIFGKTYDNPKPITSTTTTTTTENDPGDKVTTTKETKLEFTTKTELIGDNKKYVVEKSEGEYVYLKMENDTNYQFKFTITPTQKSNMPYYTKWFAYEGLDNTTKVVNTSSCQVNDAIETTTYVSTLSVSTSSTGKYGVYKIYSSSSACEADKDGKKSEGVIKELGAKIRKGLDFSKELIGDNKKYAKYIAEGEYEVDRNNLNSNLVFELEFNVTDKSNNKIPYYTRWFTYKGKDKDSGVNYISNSCSTVKTGDTNYKPTLTIPNSSDGRYAAYKIYSSSSACEADKDGKNNDDVIKELGVKITVTDSTKMVENYDLDYLSSQIGTQKSYGSKNASLTYGVYIMSGNNYKSSGSMDKSICHQAYGAVQLELTYENMMKKIIEKIDQNIPVLLEEYYKDEKGGKVSDGYKLIVGYNATKKSEPRKMNYYDLFAVNPWYTSGYPNGTTDYTLKHGTLFSLMTSGNSIDTNTILTWDSISDVKFDKTVCDNVTPDSGSNTATGYLKNPLSNTNYTTVYTSTDFPCYNGNASCHGGSSAHTGMDLNTSNGGAKKGDPVYAMESGTVSYVGKCDYKCRKSDGTGCTKVQMPGLGIKIDFGNGYEAWYFHFSSRPDDIKLNSKVSQGQLIGYVGETGNATGPHLHLSLLNQELIRINGQSGALGYSNKGFMNPSTYIDKNVTYVRKTQ